MIDQELKQEIWTTIKVDDVLSKMMKGNITKTTPFFKKHIGHKRGNILFKYTKKEIVELEKCKEDIIYFANTYCKIQTIDGIETIKLRDYQEDLLNHYVDNRFSIVSTSRQVGKTIISSIFLAWYSLFEKDKTTVIVTNKLQTSIEVMDKLKFIFDNLPFFLKPGLISNSVNTLKFDNGCRISIQSIRNAGIGFNINLLYMDEFAHFPVKMANRFYKKIYPSIGSRRDSRIIIISSATAYNKFSELYYNALYSLNKYAPFKIDWWQVSGRDELWKQKEIDNLGSEDEFNKNYNTL